jgi:hypothetical protein
MATYLSQMRPYILAVESLVLEANTLCMLDPYRPSTDSSADQPPLKSSIPVT